MHYCTAVLRCVLLQCVLGQAWHGRAALPTAGCAGQACGACQQGPKKELSCLSRQCLFKTRKQDLPGKSTLHSTPPSSEWGCTIVTPATVERWIVSKKSRMRALPDRHRERASRSGFLPANEDALELGLVSFPPEMEHYIEMKGGLYDPAALDGAVPAATAATENGHAAAPENPQATAAAAAGAAAEAATLSPAASKALESISRREFGTEAHGTRWIDK